MSTQAPIDAFDSHHCILTCVISKFFQSVFRLGQAHQVTYLRTRKMQHTHGHNAHIGSKILIEVTIKGHGANPALT